MTSAVLLYASAGSWNGVAPPMAIYCSSLKYINGCTVSGERSPFKTFVYFE